MHFNLTISCTAINMDRSGNMVWAPSAHGKADFVTHHDDGSGTSSSATSHIAGMAANIWSENPSQNKWQIGRAHV